MVGDVDISSGVREWIRLAGMEVMQGSETDDGRTLIWNKGGERRYFISAVNGYFVITSSDRMGRESFHLAALTIELIEKYLYGHFGNAVRKHRGLPHVQKPFMRDELVQKYTLGKTAFLDRERDALIGPGGATIAISADDRLVELSHYVDVPVEGIEKSFLNPDGGPLFAHQT
ncbi:MULTISPECIES: TNT antitoxin family protein [unclassified Mycobacterium]|uniref:TNT antitoxin family protein n=1 Tax=unclassified Mycobacterium TaxID=2642494 RepID=UPI001E53ADE9|nr:MULTISPECIES: TNT antitoxin family protein [unclassified Mycobacterium]